MTKAQLWQLAATRRELDAMAKVVETLLPLTQEERKEVFNEVLRRLTWEESRR